jgi:protocatechuate 3,4-dioxygenase beta subunit
VPLDPNFLGRGRVFTDEVGSYRFTTVRPGAYAWRNHANAWRPVHIHFSPFGAGVAQRLITQMCFPGDPLLALDRIFQSTVDETARDRRSCNPSTPRQRTPIARQAAPGDWRLDIRLQGEGEAVFLEV